MPKLRVHPLVFSLILLAFGVKGILWAAHDGRLGMASRNWPATSGTIGAASIAVAPSWEWSPHVVYSYAVAGVSYRGTTISFPPRSGGRAWAARVLRRYPIGHTVAVYYDPAHPEQACLEPGSDTFFLIIIPFGSVLFLAAGGWVGTRHLVRRWVFSPERSHGVGWEP